MEKMNFHKQKLYALIVAAIGVIAVLLPWWQLDFGFVNQSVNGLRDVGILTFLGFLGAGIVTFIDKDKTLPFTGQTKMIVAACFAGAGLFALIAFLRQTHFTAFGLWLSILAGVAGAALVWVIKPEQLGGNKPPTTPL